MTCRICETQVFSDLIKPCPCPTFTHRHCLDTERAYLYNNRQCHTCNTPYQFKSIDTTKSACTANMRLTTDFVLGFLFLQGFALLIGYIFRGFDTSRKLIQWMPSWFAAHTITAYYFYGVITVLALIGIAGLVCFSLNMFEPGGLLFISSPSVLNDLNIIFATAPETTIRGGDGVLRNPCYWFNPRDCGELIGMVVLFCLVLAVVIMIITLIVGAALFVGSILILIQRVIQKRIEIVYEKYAMESEQVIDLNESKE